jgi:uncharacterized protein
MSRETTATDTVDIHHQPALGRFLAEVDGHACVLEYTVSGGRMVIEHTRVPQAVGGRGIAGSLVRAALEWARATGLRVVPQCPYAAAYMQRHHEFDDLLARD